MDFINGEKICALSSIGAPESFEQTLVKLNCELIKHFVFIDHYKYTDQDIQPVVDKCLSQKITTIMTTEKDIVKLRHFLQLIPDQISLLALKIKIDITDGEDKFLERINCLL